MAIRKCEFACPGSTYHDGNCGVREDADKEVQNPRFNVNAFERCVQFYGLGSGCQLKVFNDGLGGLPVEHLPDQKSNRFDRTVRIVDITCVGPENPACPKRQGFKLVKIKVDGCVTDMARRK
jgi:hypothetical protein